MKVKQPTENQTKVQNITALPVVTLDDKEMSVVSGGRIVWGT